MTAKRRTAKAVKFTRIKDGHYVQPESGIELTRGLDDSDGWDRIVWLIWTANRGECIGWRDSLNEAKARAREIASRAA